MELDPVVQATLLDIAQDITDRSLKSEMRVGDYISQLAVNYQHLLIETQDKTLAQKRLLDSVKIGPVE